MSTVSVVIPTWNRADLLSAALQNLRGQSRTPEQIVVVDNGSTDRSCEIAREFQAELVAFDTNRGFAVAINEGIRRATGDWILILNNDVVLSPAWIETMVSAAEAARADFAAGKLLASGTGRTLDGSWDLVSRGAYAWRCGYLRPDGPPWTEPRTIALAPMTAALFHRRVFDRIGLLETRFESYYEDVDFGLRCALAGLSGIYEPRAEAVHLGKATLGSRAARVYFLSGRNQVLLLAKHYPNSTLRRFAWPILVGQALALFAATRQRHPVAAIKGKWEALRLWGQFRSEARRTNAAQLERILADNEGEIRQIQRMLGYDIYWRLYFSLVSA